MIRLADIVRLHSFMIKDAADDIARAKGIKPKV